MIFFLSLALLSISLSNAVIKDELNTKNERLKNKNSITKIILDNKLPKPTAWKIEEFSKSLNVEQTGFDEFFKYPVNNKRSHNIVNNNKYYIKKDLKEDYNNNHKLHFLNNVENHYFENLKNIYYSSIPLTKKIKTFKDHPVLYGYYKAWIDHCPISISPNIIWQLILNAIGNLINNNYEDLRHNFVDFKGKKSLEFKINITSLNIEKENWERFLYNISRQIKANTKKNIYENIILNFTTNTKDLLLVQEISSMSMFQKYFEYNFFVEEICGFPYIELEGTIEDWELILNKIQKFKNLGVDNWIEIIKKILKKIIDSKKGNIDRYFWKNLIIYRKEDINSYRMCGEPKSIYGFTGWITNFFPFNKNGEYLYENNYISIYNKISIYDKENYNILSEISTTPMKLHIKYADNTKKDFDLIIYSGVLGVSQDPETFLVKPELGFFITENNEDYSNGIDINNLFKHFNENNSTFDGFNSFFNDL